MWLFLYSDCKRLWDAIIRIVNLVVEAVEVVVAVPPMYLLLYYKRSRSVKLADILQALIMVLSGLCWTRTMWRR